MLGNVEVRQWVEGIPIAITVLVRSPIFWSADNNIAVLTQLGTYIFELSLSSEECSPSIVYTRSFIPPPKEPSRWQNTGIQLKSMVEQVDHSISHTVMLDGVLSAGQRTHSEQPPLNIRNLSPAVPGGIANHLGYHRGAWSPLGVGVQSRCLLALVTHDHQMSIVGQEGRQWKKLVDITGQWYNYVSANSWALVNLPKSCPSHEVFTARMSMLSILEIQWTPLCEDNAGKFSVLLTVTASGHIAFWRVPAGFSGKEDIQIIGVKKANIKSVSAFRWSYVSEGCGYIVIGNNNGQVKVFYCKIDGNGILLRDLGFAFDDDYRIQVNYVQLVPLCNEQYLLLLGKHNIFVAATIDLTEDKLQIHNTTHCHVGKLAISGVVYLENTNIYVAVKDGLVQRLCIKLAPERNISIELTGNSFRSEGVAFTGLVTSPNASLWGILESVSVAYDHLVVREPTQLNIYQVSKSTTIMNHLLENPSPLYSHTDLLESLRLSACKGGGPIKFPSSKEITSRPLQEVKVFYWLAKMSRSIRVSDIKPIEHLEELELHLQTVILEEWIRDCLQKLTSAVMPMDPSISLSISLMCEWMGKKDNESDVKLSKSVKKKIGTVSKEQCLVCKENVKLDSLVRGKCKKGHTLPRCCRTFLLSRPTVQCPRCRVFIHSKASLLLSGSPTCVYCDGLMADEIGGRRKPKK
ncbi:general transcription factor 3C polypeptide 4-like isoform X1 [Penaeus japonicus]|uniref:general transcription factor 3C polypeptide 4-like isoform X1 n=1 Tax=Penaeus japonicus TaxID=27405 RepID=UPI001C70E7D2|nr:general transcription factor 3C polypeptide 4-like isoform X1 [Penaeus japonicus]